MTREELLRSREFWMVQLQNDLYGVMNDYLMKNNLTRKDLAEKLNVTKGYITQVLNGDFDHKISKFVDLTLAANKVPIVHFEDVDEYIKNDSCGAIKKYSFVNKRPVQYNIFIGKIDDEESNLINQKNIESKRIRFSKIK